MKTHPRNPVPLAAVLAGLALNLSVIQPARAASRVTTGSMNSPRGYNHTATLLSNGKVLAAGGYGAGFLSSAELYDPATGTWTATGSMNTARCYHAATLLPNGKVLVAGGWNNSILTSAELYDPASGTWTATGSMNTGRYAHTATLLPNGKVLVTGGSGTSGVLASTELYDPASGTWTATGSMNYSRQWHTATLLPDGKVLVVGGGNTSAEFYDPASGTWTATGSMDYARTFHTATLLPNGKVLVAGGSDLNSLASAELYDPASGTWTAPGSLNTARAHHTATLLPNGKVLIADGEGTSGPLASTELYDPASGTWTAPGSLNTARADHTATLLPNGKVLIAGGEGTSGLLASAELYDPASGTWTATGSLTTGREVPTATLLPNGRVLVAGGINDWSSGSLASAELYDPASETCTATGPLNSARAWHTATLLPNGKVLAAGGYSSTSGHLASAELYDPANGTWTATGALNTARAWHTATLLPNGKVLVAGGYNSSGDLASAELYDPANGTWTVTAALSTARANHTATLLPNGKVLVAGGQKDRGSELTSVELFDPASGTWTATGALNTARYYHTAMLLPNGKVLVAGGCGTVGYLASAELYDPASATWTATGSLNIGRFGHTATLLLNGKVLVVGGNRSDYLASAELYDPASATWLGTGALNIARAWHTATVLPNGKVLVAAGWNGFTWPASAELYDVGLGFSASWQPQIATLASPLTLGSSLGLTGSLFRGVSGGSCGNSHDSPTDYPLVQLRNLESGQTLFLPPSPGANWSATSFTSAPLISFPPGYALVTVFVNGIPSTSAILPIYAAPAAPVPISPNTPGQSATPYYTFNTVPGATSYTIFLWDYATASSTVFGPLTPAQVDFGTPGQGRFLQPTALAQGTYTWVVSASNAAGTSPWSSYMTFTVGTVPDAPVPISPNTPGQSATPYYTFNTVPGATSYTIFLWDYATASSKVFGPLTPAQVDFGTPDQGRFLQPTALAQGTYTWVVSASNAAGTSPWSTYMTFSVDAVPVAPVPISPNTPGQSATPYYTFNTVPGAASYTIFLWDYATASSTVFGPLTPAQVDFGTPGQGRFLQPAALAQGTYTWVVSASNAAGTSPWSSYMTFIVGTAPVAPVPISPNTPGQSATPYYTFNTVPGATSYTIFLWDYATASSTVFGSLTPAQVDFGTPGQGRFLQPTALALGTYTWVVSASNASGTSPWSIYMTFTVGTVPVAPVPISPNTPGQSATPYYTFNTVPGATSYTIFLWDYATASSTVFSPLTAAAVDFGTPGQGRFLQPTALAQGTYTWVVSASNAAGTSPWSSYMTFNVGP